MSISRTRRDFLQITALTGFGLYLAETVQAESAPPAPRPKSPNEQIQFACIGIGGKGDSDTADAAKNGVVVAVCDVDANRLAEATKKYPGAKQYNDYRKMYEEMGGKIDAVTVSTPDHNHADCRGDGTEDGQALLLPKAPDAHHHRGAAYRRNCQETPKSRRKWEIRGRRTPICAVPLPRCGREPSVMFPRCTSGRIRAKGWWPQGKNIMRGAEKARPCQPELGGVARPRAVCAPYADGYHYLHLAWMVGFWNGRTGRHCLPRNEPALHGTGFARILRRFAAETAGHNGETYPEWSIITYEFPATKPHAPPSNCSGTMAARSPRRTLAPGQRFWRQRQSSYRQQGQTHHGRVWRRRAVSWADRKSRMSSSWSRPVTLRSGCRRSARRDPYGAMSNFPNYASGLTETVLMGNLAVWQPQTRIEWDSKRLRASKGIGKDRRTDVISKEYRKGWSL